MGATFWKNIYTKLLTSGGIEFQDGRIKTQGSGSPEGVVTASVGSEYTDTSTGVLYLKQSGSGNTGWGANVNPALKDIIDYSKPPGEVFFLPYQKDLDLVFDPLAPRDYFPAINLSAIEGSATLSSLGASGTELYTILSTLLLQYFPGQSGEVDTWSCTVTDLGATSSIVFPNTVSANATLAGMYEDQVINGGYSDWRCCKIGATHRLITDINLVTRTITSTEFSGLNGTYDVTFAAYSQSGGEIRIYEVSGEAIMAPNDPDGYFIMNLRTRGYFQGHRMNRLVSGIAEYTLENSAGGSQYQSGGSFLNGTRTTTGDPVTDGTNGTPLVRKITHGPAYTLIPYMWCGG